MSQPLQEGHIVRRRDTNETIEVRRVYPDKVRGVNQRGDYVEVPIKDIVFVARNRQSIKA